jgi:hypothetical protein
MSRTHARFCQRSEDVFPEDLNRCHGTFILVRGEALVRFGTAVLLGSQGFAFFRERPVRIRRKHPNTLFGRISMLM